jgi:hypothetical protein
LSEAEDCCDDDHYILLRDGVSFVRRATSSRRQWGSLGRATWARRTFDGRARGLVVGLIMDGDGEENASGRV